MPTSTPATARPSLWQRWPATILCSLAAATSLAMLATTGSVELPAAVDEAPEDLGSAEPAAPPHEESDEEKSDGTRHKGEEGRMGKATPKMARAFDPDLAARNAGILGVMSETKGHYLASPYGGAFAVGSDDGDVWGGLTGTEIGEAYGVGGLGLVGTGRGGGGTGEGTIGLGHGYGYGGKISEGRYDDAIQSHALTVGTVDDNADPAAYAKALARLGERHTLGIDERMWHLEPPAIRHDARPTGLDVALVIDTTGSMGDELEYLKVEIRDIATEISRELPGVKQRWALVAYRDQGDEYVTRHFDFQAIDGFVDALGKQQAEGGGDMPEAMDAGLDLSSQLSWRADASTARMVFLVADAPSHADERARKFAGEVVEHQRARTAIYPVAGSGVDPLAEAQLRLAAKATGGQYIFLTDHSGIGGSHAAPKVDQFKVETLHAAMTRMIRDELGGSGITTAPGHLPVASPPLCGESDPITFALADVPVFASFWDEFRTRLAEHLQVASSLALLMLAGLGVDTLLARRRRRA